MEYLTGQKTSGSIHIKEALEKGAAAVVAGARPDGELARLFPLAAWVLAADGTRRGGFIGLSAGAAAFDVVHGRIIAEPTVAASPWCRSGWIWVAVGGVVLVAGGAVTLWALTRDSQTQTRTRVFVGPP